jgi:cytochrome c biogenesis protein CcmG/thiol:disulfide interchange protein DsbE
VKRPAGLAFVVLLLASVFLTVAAGRPGGATATPGLPGPAVGRVAPAFSLTALGGGTASLAGARGTPVLLNFWATWCTECRAELPALQSLHAALGSQLALLGVDVQEPQTLVQPFVQQYGVSWPVLLDTHADVASAYDVHYLPTSFFIDRAGVIRRIYTGPLTVGQMRAFLRDAASAG